MYSGLRVGGASPGTPDALPPVDRMSVVGSSWFEMLHEANCNRRCDACQHNRQIQISQDIEKENPFNFGIMRPPEVTGRLRRAEAPSNPEAELADASVPTCACLCTILPGDTDCNE